MLHRASELKKCHLDARDGTIGKIKDLLFDDESWAVRYLVANTGKWLPGRRVLLSPLATLGAAMTENKLPVDLTKSQIEKSPGIEADQLVSPQYQRDLHTYYGWPAYWAVAPYPIAGVMPPPLTPVATSAETTSASTPSGPANDPHLRSVADVVGYKIHASDGTIGHVDDFLVDVGDWMVRFIVVDTKNWVPGKKVVVTTAMVDRISWTGSEVAVLAPRDAIKDCPEYRFRGPVTPEYEQRLIAYYDSVTAHR